MIESENDNMLQYIPLDLTDAGETRPTELAACTLHLFGMVRSGIGMRGLYRVWLWVCLVYIRIALQFLIWTAIVFIMAYSALNVHHMAKQ